MSVYAIISLNVHMCYSGEHSRWSDKTAAHLSVAFRRSHWKANMRMVPHRTASLYRRWYQIV